jgi:transcriptional regulator with PAS, ATPase and Fis domain
MGNSVDNKNQAAGSACENKPNFEYIIGKSPKLRKVLDLAREVICTDTAILILGESGTGKELLAQAIHYNSHRAKGPFIALHCVAFPENLLESELFGYEKGAFTGAETTKPGRFELAQGGTLFLDEIGDMSLNIQAKLLRVLQQKEFMRLGGTVSLKTDVRIISATNKDLFRLIAEGKFREDLLYRINVFPLTLPPLRERKEDIPLLVLHFIWEFSIKVGKQIKGISQNALACLSAYHWVGNIRELQNVIERAVILSKNSLVTVDDLPGYITKRGKAKKSSSSGFVIPPEGICLEKLERDIILQALERCDYNKTQAARLIGLSRSKFRYRLRKHNLPV